MARTVLILCVLSVVTAAGGCGEERPGPSNAPQAPKISAGFKAYVDPVTGETLERPHEMAPALELDDTHATSARGLREIVSPEPGGGVSVDLEGRFQVPLEATVTPPAAPRTAP